MGNKEILPVRTLAMPIIGYIRSGGDGGHARFDLQARHSGHLGRVHGHGAGGGVSGDGGSGQGVASGAKFIQAESGGPGLVVAEDRTREQQHSQKHFSHKTLLPGLRRNPSQDRQVHTINPRRILANALSAIKATPRHGQACRGVGVRLCASRESGTLFRDHG